ncbi:AhpC/TSA antioxidant enzyme [Rhizoctonia solani AG-3 Rhs1AP]|uniref:AhpC/TSA antioxidant enzyme n=1 Tax=Rhizoctonia solani AG-3 Rhs1AP TaxID=1086054 RepID=X8JN33_9AGAM|nr:AhpC/TSA antioxidant enzyme [Rhizoctonia solani AG-3 Rhs1AP]
MLTESQPTDNMELPTKPHPYLNHNLSSTTFHTSISSFTHFAPTFPSHSQSSLGHSIKARYPDPYSDNPFLPLKELRRLRSTEILNAKTSMMQAVLDDEDQFLGVEMSALAEPHTPGLTPDSTASDENLPNVDFSPTSSTGALPYTSYFARTRRSRSRSLDSDDDGFYTPTYQTAVPSDSPGNDELGYANEYSDTEKDVPEPVKAPNPSTPSRKRPPPIQVENQEPRLTSSSPGKASTFITVDEEEADDVVESPRPRSVKLSAASAFSLSLFPPTPTTPMNRQSWVRNSGASIDSTSFSPTRHSLGGPSAFSTPRRTAPSTPTRRTHRATMEIDRPRRSEILFRPGRASVDAFQSRANTSSDSSYSQTTDSASFYSGGPSIMAPSRLRESSYMQSDSAFETCAESVSLSRTSKDVLSQSCEDVLSTRVIPPTRKPVPRVDSELIEMDVKSRVSLSNPVPVSTSPTTTSGISFNSVSVLSNPKTKKKKGRKLVIGHPHMNDESSRTTLSNTTLPIGPKVTHSDSLGSLRDELLGNASSLGMFAKAKGRRLKKVKKPCQPFDKSGLPSEDQLELASNMYVYDETSRPVRFGDIFKDQKTAICFIRHFWCPLCQDYMSSIVHLTEPSLVQQAGVKLVIIGNGSPSMIKSYKTDIFHCPYEMYTDPERKVYNALGMTLRTTDGGSEEDKGSYVKHGTFTGTMMVMKRALKMPLANAGDIKQLGGEFILGPGLNCSFASRMHTTRSHTPIRDLLQAAGVSMNPSATKLSILGSPTDSARWMDAQSEDMDNMIRKGLRASCGDNCTLDAEQDTRQDLGEFRRLIERLKDQGSEPESEPVYQPTTYLLKTAGQSRTDLDQLEAAEAR